MNKNLMEHFFNLCNQQTANDYLWVRAENSDEEKLRRRERKVPRLIYGAILNRVGYF